MITDLRYVHKVCYTKMVVVGGGGDDDESGYDHRSRRNYTVFNAIINQVLKKNTRHSRWR